MLESCGKPWTEISSDKSLRKIGKRPVNNVTPDSLIDPQARETTITNVNQTSEKTHSEAHVMTKLLNEIRSQKTLSHAFLLMNKSIIWIITSALIADTLVIKAVIVLTLSTPIKYNSRMIRLNLNQLSWRIPRSA